LKETTMKLSHILAAAVLATTLGAHAQTQTAPASAAAPMVEGEVRKIDKEQGKISLRHGPIPNLDMGAMSMVFRVSDPKMLDTVKDGDKVKFTADKVNGAFTVMSIQVAD
jgi:Cu(I)/Ag(I) efflux system protein CusF